MRLPPPRQGGYYDTLSIEFKDGTMMNLPYFDNKGSEYYLQKLWDQIDSFKIVPYEGVGLPTKKELDKAA